MTAIRATPVHRAIVGLLILASVHCNRVGDGGGPIPPPGPTDPTLPTLLNTAYTAPTGATITVPAGGDFQAALNSAQPGDQILLAAG
ncbi:MAG: hypothetical protein DMF98_07940, partial [Acidobacteria bacterium]